MAHGLMPLRTCTLMRLSCQANRRRHPDDGSGEEDQALRDAQVAGVSDEYVAARVSAETEASRTEPSHRFWRVVVRVL